ncbi:MAG: DNA repair protein RecO [Kofleriaceae bacterium]|nr:DNA repair protein RecO [Kofleriaceae bacterium]
MGLRRVSAEPAIILRRSEFGESDLVIVMYCRNIGKITAIGRAARRSKKRFGGGLGIFTHSEVSLSIKPNSQMWTLESAVPIVLFENLATDIARMVHGSYATELARELSVDEFPDPDLFDLLVELFHSLQGEGAKVGRLRIFEMRLLDILGLTPVLDCCACCAASLEEGIISMDAERGGLVCEKCIGENPGKWIRRIGTQARKYLADAQSLAQSLGPLSLGDALEGRVAAVAARQAILSILCWHVGKPLKSLEFIASMSRTR